MESMFIEFRGHIIKVVEKDGKRVAMMSTQEELANESTDLILLDQDPETLTQNAYNLMMNKVFKEIEGEWHKDLKKNVMKIMGFNDGWGKWEVDHCNGRMSDMTNLIAAETKKLLLEQITPEALTLSDKEKKDLVAAVRKDAFDRSNYQYRREFESRFESLIKEQARLDAEEQFKEMLKQKGDGLEVVKFINRKLQENR